MLGTSPARTQVMRNSSVLVRQILLHLPATLIGTPMVVLLNSSIAKFSATTQQL